MFSRDFQMLAFLKCNDLSSDKRAFLVLNTPLSVRLACAEGGGGGVGRCEGIISVFPGIHQVPNCSH